MARMNEVFDLTFEPRSGRRLRPLSANGRRRNCALAGATFQAIIDALGYGNRSSATDAVTRALRDTTPKELTDEVRRIENERLDRLWAPMHVKALKGDYLAVDRCLRIMARRAALNGLDAPIRVRQAVITEEDIDAAIARIDREAKALEGSGSAGGGPDAPPTATGVPMR
jgi:hypothetical protein